MKSIKEPDKKEKLDKCIQMLFQAIISDLKDNITHNQAGWRNPSELGLTSQQLDRLFGSGILKKNPLGKIRIDFEDKSIRKKFSSSKLQFKEIDYLMEYQDSIMEEKKKLQKIQEILANLKKVINKNPENLPSMIAVGLWKMLNTSDMSTIVDNILEEGFSPKEWIFISNRSASSLSLDLAQKIGRIRELLGAFEFIKNIGLVEDAPLLLSPNKDDIQRVKKVLRWDKIKRDLTEENIKFLGLSWLTVFVLELNEVLPLYTDFSVKTIDLTRNCVEEIMDANWEDLRGDLENFFARLEKQGIKWASNIIFLPEVV